MIVRLTDAEQRLAQFIARERYRRNREQGTTDAKVGPQDCETTDLEGFAAELAACKLLNIYPDLSLDARPDADALLRDGRFIDVKATKYRNGRLLAVPGKRGKAVDVFVLMVGEFPEYRCAGFMDYEELIRNERLTDLGHGPTFAALQAQLRQAP